MISVLIERFGLLCLGYNAVSGEMSNHTEFNFPRPGSSVTPHSELLEQFNEAGCLATLDDEREAFGVVGASAVLNGSLDTKRAVVV